MSKRVKLDAEGLICLRVLARRWRETEPTTLIVRDLEHAAFVARSDHLLAQLSTRIDFVRVGGVVVAVANGRRLLFESIFCVGEGGGLQKRRLVSSVVEEMENLVSQCDQ